MKYKRKLGLVRSFILLEFGTGADGVWLQEQKQPLKRYTSLPCDDIIVDLLHPEIGKIVQYL
jgi:hypothetical protein